MAATERSKDLIQNYKRASPEGRVEMMMDNYKGFPGLIKKAESKTRYLIKSEREYRRSHSRGELGVRVNTSDLSDPTYEEAKLNILIEQSFETGTIEKGIIDGLEGETEYEESIYMISVMRYDYNLLNEIIDGCDEEDIRIMKRYLVDKKVYREIAEEENCSYDSIRRIVIRVRDEIKEEMIESLEKMKKRTTDNKRNER